MRYTLLACDYDGTLARDGLVDGSVMESLTKLRSSGRRLILVTGRRLEDLRSVFPNIDIFDYVVCENGAVLFCPTMKTTKLLAAPPSTSFIQTLKACGIQNLEIGQVVVAGWRPSETAILEVIQTLGLDLHITFNKGAVMVLPPGVNKGSGLLAALKEMNISTRNVVAVGDAENDHSLFDVCECSAAVANALPSVKEHADVVLKGDHGAGVIELIETIFLSDLKDFPKSTQQRKLRIGTSDNGDAVSCCTYDYKVLVAGPSQSGKTTAAMSILEQFSHSQYQYLVIDPEGDYQGAPSAVSIGNAHYVPRVEDVMRLLDDPHRNVVVNLLGVPLIERTAFLANMLKTLQSMRRERGRPHWIVIDEAHHMLHPFWDQTISPIWEDTGAVLMITIDPSQLSKTVLSSIDLVLAVGPTPINTLSSLAKVVEEELPHFECKDGSWGRAVAWFRKEQRAPFQITIDTTPIEQYRHRRKYAEGNVGQHRSFYFTGPNNKLKIRCQNLFLFLQIGDGVDDDTWMFHLRRGDYSKWISEVIKDQGLSEEVASVEKRNHQSASESRAEIRNLIDKRYSFATALGVV